MLVPKWAEQSFSGGTPVNFEDNFRTLFKVFNQTLFENKIELVTLEVCDLANESALGLAWNGKPSVEDETLDFGIEFDVRFAGYKRDHIQLAREALQTRSLVDNLSTIVHEMCHVYEYQHGPDWTGGHTEYWAILMERVGLMPSHNRQPGGERTGARIAHYIIPNGPFERVARQLLPSRPPPLYGTTTVDDDANERNLAGLRSHPSGSSVHAPITAIHDDAARSEAREAQRVYAALASFFGFFVPCLVILGFGVNVLLWPDAIDLEQQYKRRHIAWAQSVHDYRCDAVENVSSDGFMNTLADRVSFDCVKKTHIKYTYPPTVIALFALSLWISVLTGLPVVTLLLLILKANSEHADHDTTEGQLRLLKGSVPMAVSNIRSLLGRWLYAIGLAVALSLILYFIRVGEVYGYF